MTKYARIENYRLMSSRTSPASEGSPQEHGQGMNLVAWRPLAALLLGVTFPWAYVIPNEQG
ncbi:MAG: hypothetical protein KAT23_04215, partial [Anaerolineales bacterium]|nr:hypothetical protein [Anaerolineales bacterium]